MLFYRCLLFCSSISASRLAGIIGALFIPVPIGTILCGGGFLVPHAGLLPPACPSSLLLSQPCLHLPHQARQAYHGRQPQHSSYELVPADVAHCIKPNSKVFAGTPQQALLKAYEEAAAEEE